MSSLSAAAFHRVLSPSLDAITNAVISSSFANEDLSPTSITRLSNELVASFHGKISLARSIDAVIDCIYPDYRDAVRPHILEFAS